MYHLNVRCSKCKKAFISADHIYSNSCGHVFHDTCLNNWENGYGNCPKCNARYNRQQIIYLDFDNSQNYDKVVNDLNAEIESSKDEEKKLQEENTRLYNSSEQMRAELEERIKKMARENEIQIENHSMEMQLQKTLNETLEEKIKKMALENEIQIENHSKEMQLQKTLNEVLVDKIKKLALENAIQIENHTKEVHMHETLTEMLHKVKGIQDLSDKINENTTSSKFQQSRTESETLNQVLMKRIEMVEQRLNQEFEENVKQTPQQRTRAENSNRGDAKSQENIIKADNQPLERKRQPNDCSILIKEFINENLVYPLEDTVILLASKMAINLTTEDILDVKIVGTKNTTIMPNKIVLQVEFNDIDVKRKVLACRNRLKFDPLTRDIQIEEHINDVAYSLFMYAITNLRVQGRYEYVTCKDNKVYVKKKKSDTKEILIENKDDVDELVKVTEITSEL